MTETTLKPMPPRPRPGDDRWWPAATVGLIALPVVLVLLGGIAMGLVVLGEQWLPNPQAMIEVLP